jgi:hypothetical protein
LANHERGLTTKINLDDLKQKASLSMLGESYITLETSEEYRIGFGFKRKSESSLTLFIELVVTLCSNDKPNLERLESQIKLLKAIEKRGYLLICEDDGTFTCETSVTEARLEGELEIIHNILIFTKKLNDRRIARKNESEV